MALIKKVNHEYINANLGIAEKQSPKGLKTSTIYFLGLPIYKEFTKIEKSKS